MKENFYAAKSMIKPLGLGYQKIDMCPNFCMLYITLKMLSWPSTWHVGIPITNPELVEGRLSWHIKNLDTS